MAGRTYKPGEIAVRGEALYREGIQQLVGTVKKGSFVVIDVESDDYEVDASDVAATRRLLDRRPDAATYAVRTGNRAAYSYVGNSGSLGPAIKEGESADRPVSGSIEVVDAEGRLRPVEVLLDTEFTGCLALSAETVRQLGLSSVGRRTLKFANGEWSESEAYLATAVWHGHLTDVLVLESDSAPLLGMTLIWGCRVTVDAVMQGEVSIEDLDAEGSEDIPDAPPTATGLFGRLLGSARRVLINSAFVIILGAAIVAFAFGVDSLPLDFGEIITFMGIWLALGVILGQNKPPGIPLRPYLERRIISFACTYVAFTAIAIGYIVQKDGGGAENIMAKELWGLFVLSLLGFAVGFFAGQDKDPE